MEPKTQEQPTLLAIKNHHKRDEQILFEEEEHKYTILCDKETKYTSVTTYVHDQFEKFDADLIIGKMMASPYWPKNKYYGKKPYEIKELWEKNRDEAANAGTKMHYDIECYYNEMDVSNDSIEFQYFKEFLEKHQHMKAYRTEWTVFDTDLKLAGSIDMVFYNEKDNTYHIYDWKRCKEIKKSNGYNKYSINPILSDLPDTNYWHYTLQLNIYKALLEKNYDMKISSCALVCLHPENKNKSFQIHKVPDLNDTIQKLFNVREENVKRANIVSSE
jgi:ATP-dependent exoDNAse (exonuclease V) beta subunit